MIVKTVAAMFVIVLSASCARVDKARLQFASDGKGDMAIRTLVDPEAFDRDGGQTKDRVLEDARQCGFTTQLNRRQTTYALELSASFTGNVPLARYFDCLPLEWSRRVVRMTTDHSLIYKNYRSLVLLEQPVAIRPSDSELRPVVNPDEPIDDNAYGISWILLPLSLEVTVPGRIVAIEDRTAFLGGTTKSTFTENVATIALDMPNGAELRNDLVERELERLARPGQTNPKMDRYEIEIHSREARFDLTTFSALAALLFGSGIAAPVIAYFRRTRQTSEKPAPRTSAKRRRNRK